VPLGKWILEEACTQASSWQKKYGFDESLAITVNVASRQFFEDTFLETVENALRKSKLPPQSLVLEITETTMLVNAEATIRTLTALKRLGIRLAIDDFGTGYSSLSYLQRFPVDILKIDKSFVDQIALGKEGAAVARAIITMSGTLHLRTIAEGIESASQQTELQNLGCELGQGYLFAKPLRKADMNEFLRTAARTEKESLSVVPPAMSRVDENGSRLIG
jgi:EAL domain-containing protein (putative c-di-GMP-specific phosphodiesterase class I)